MPSSAVETMQLGGMAGLAALTMGMGQDKQEKAIALANSGPAGAQPASTPMEGAVVAPAV